MADIFVSYARADKARVAPLVATLKAQGWSVWWDPAIIPGQEFDDLIAEEIDKASAVVVVWTPASVSSRWVRGEAREAADRGVLVPVRFDNARLPIDVRAVHTTDLDTWREDAKSAPFQEVLGALSLLLSASESARVAAEQKTSICVLPFANMSNDPEQEYFSDGISEDIITDLSKVRALTVISRNSAFTFKGKHVDLPEVARQLKVTHVLEGSVRKSGNRVRITAQLIDGATNGHVWADRYDRSLDDIFALQDEISEAIVAALKLKLFPAEKKAIEDRGTANTAAYDLYLRARALSRTFAPAEIQRAIEIYREVLALDPQFALAWDGLAGAAERAILNTAGDRADLRKTSEEAYNRVQELAPDAWTTQLSVAGQLFMHRDWLGMERAIARAAVLAPPSDPLILRFQGGYVCCALGRAREAIDGQAAYLRAEPLSLEASFMMQMILDIAGEPAKAWAEYERSKDLSGDRAIVEWFAFLRLCEEGDAARSKQQFARYLEHENVTMPVHRHLADILDQPAAALALIRSAYDEPHYQDSTRQNILAFWAAHYGDMDIALLTMRRSLIEMKALTPAWIWLPIFAQVRKDPRIKKVIRDLGLYEYWRKTGKWGDFARPLGDDDFEIIK